MRTESTWFPLEQELCLNSSNLRHRGENVGAVSSCSLQTVAMVDLTIPCFLIHIELSETQTQDDVIIVIKFQCPFN